MLGQRHTPDHTHTLNDYKYFLSWHYVITVISPVFLSPFTQNILLSMEEYAITPLSVQKTRARPKLIPLVYVFRTRIFPFILCKIAGSNSLGLKRTRTVLWRAKLWWFTTKDWASGIVLSWALASQFLERSEKKHQWKSCTWFFCFWGAIDHAIVLFPLSLPTLRGDFHCGVQLRPHLIPPAYVRSLNQKPPFLEQKTTLELPRSFGSTPLWPPNPSKSQR